MFDLIMKAFESNAVMATIVSGIVALFPVIVAWLYKSRKYIWEAVEIIDALKETAEFVDELAKAADPSSPGGSKYTKEEIEKIRKKGEEARAAINKSAIGGLLKKFKKNGKK
uniref:Uncharacterized protein n=1 Tax=viral metagenome TaxID=1070528 RepID=A0A6M3KSW9_9ZZZZ